MMVETNRIEYKRELSKELDLEKEVVAFLNYREGGYVYQGNDGSGLVAFVSAPRNKELMRIYRDLELVEQLGSGVPRILQVYNRSCFKFFPNFIRMTFPKNQEEEGGAISGAIGGVKGGAIGGIIGGTIGGTIDDLTDRQLEVLTIIESNPFISISAIAKRLNINRSAIQAHFDALKEKRIISRVGGTRGSWKINLKKKK